MRVEILDRFPPDLNEVALDSPQATFYHTDVWIKSISEAYPSMKFRCLVAEDGGEIVGYLPFFVMSKGPTRSFWSLPFGTYGGPVSRGDDHVSGVLLERYTKMRWERGAREVGLVDFY
ncbi:MAG: hypothetical protein JSW58_12230, partial [Candidatus Latescibacterota bacterium]